MLPPSFTLPFPLKISLDEIFRFYYPLNQYGSGMFGCFCVIDTELRQILWRLIPKKWLGLQVGSNSKDVKLEKESLGVRPVLSFRGPCART